VAALVGRIERIKIKHAHLTNLIKHKHTGVLTTITDIYEPNREEFCSYGFEYSDGEVYIVPCNLIDDENVYELEPSDVLIDIEAEPEPEPEP
jgi:hypothetical protein